MGIFTAPPSAALDLRGARETCFAAAFMARPMGREVSLAPEGARGAGASAERSAPQSKRGPRGGPLRVELALASVRAHFRLHAGRDFELLWNCDGSVITTSLVGTTRCYGLNSSGLGAGVEGRRASRMGTEGDGPETTRGSDGSGRCAMTRGLQPQEESR